MKRCPNCNQVFADENIFCLSDGTTLISEVDETLTVIKSSQPFQQPLPIVKQGVSPIFAYSAIGLLSLFAGGAIVAYLKSDLFSPASPSVNTKIETPNTASNIVPQKTTTPKMPMNTQKVETVRDPDSKPQPLTAESVRNFLVAWETAQNKKNFTSYQAFYDSSFVGVASYPSGVSKTFGSYNEWMDDRRKMFANLVRVDMANLEITVDGDTAIAKFEQTYRSKNDFCDIGPKKIELKMTPSGPKITYEILETSTRC